MARDLECNDRAKIVPSEEMREDLRERISAYSEQFFHPENESGRDYWLSRALSLETARAFQIGFVATPHVGDVAFTSRLAIPYLTPAGPVGLKFRSTKQGGGEAKYLYNAGATHRIFNPGALSSTEGIVITEGEIDAISFVQAGLSAIGMPGATSFKRHWRRALYNRDITIFCDGDDPGREFGEGLASLLYGARIVVAPEGEDANSILQQHGPEELRGMVAR